MVHISGPGAQAVMESQTAHRWGLNLRAYHSEVLSTEQPPRNVFPNLCYNKCFFLSLQSFLILNYDRFFLSI